MERTLKNIEKPVRVYRVQIDGASASTVGAALRGRPKGPRYWQKGALAVVVVLLVGAGIVAVRRLYLPPSPGQPQGVVPTTSQAEVPFEQPQALALPDKPSIAVLPFVNLSGDPEQEYFSDGMTEDLITDLSRLSGLFVISRNSVFFYKGKAVEVGDLSKELGVRYVLEGSVRKADNQVRITAQLVDATTGHHLWAERYDRPLKEIFSLQDEITQRIVLALRVKLMREEQERFRRFPTDNLEAYDYLLRGVEYFYRFTKEANVQARQMCEKAIELDPKYAAAYVWLGATYWQDWFWQGGQDPQTLERAFELTQRAIALDDSLSMAHALLGDLYLLKKQHEQAIAELERAIALDPNNAFGYSDLGYILNFAGKPQEAIGLEEKAMRLNPHYPAIWLWMLGHAYRLTGRYEEAIAAQKRALARNPNTLPAHGELAVIYSELGREEEARAEVKELLRINPNFSLESVRQMAPFKDPAVLERFLAALRKAGLK